MFRKMIATASLVTSLMAVSGPALAIPGADELADPRPSPEVDIDLKFELADPRPSPKYVK